MYLSFVLNRFNENYNSDEEENSSKNTDSISIDTNGEFKMRKFV